MIISETAMKEFARELGQAVQGGELFELIGDVGAGKTTFTKGLAEGMGVTEAVQSPTFTISRVYDTPGDLELRHYDFYRLNAAGIMADELAEAVADPLAVTVVEWAEVVESVLLEDRLQLRITATGEHTREVTLTAQGARAERLLEIVV